MPTDGRGEALFRQLCRDRRNRDLAGKNDRRWTTGDAVSGHSFCHTLWRRLASAAERSERPLDEDRIEIEETVYCGGAEGPRRATQIVILGRARQVPRVHWTFTHTPKTTPKKAADAAAKRTPQNEPELPL